MDNTTTLSADVNFTGTVNLFSQTIPLGAASLGAIPIGPIVVTPEISAHLNLSAGATGSIKYDPSISESVHVGFTLTANVGSGIQCSRDGNNGFGSPKASGLGSVDASIGVEASAGVTLEFTLAIDAVAGPDAQATASLVLSASTSQTPWWSLKAEGDFGIGLNLNALGIPCLSDLLGALHIKASYDWTLGHLGPYTLASASGAAPGPTGGGGSGGPGGDPGSSPGSTGGGSSVGVVGGSSIGPVPPGSLAETSGSYVHTWTDASSGGGVEGPTIAKEQTLGIGCKLHGLAVANGNTWWYQITSSPWTGNYYASADAFYNNGATSGSLQGTPYVDPAVPDCNPGSSAGSSTGGTSGGVPGTPETAGGQVHTWTNAANGGGTEGPAIAGGSTINIVCKLHGLTVADGNTWWYEIGSNPWNGNFYASADAFYNNGATSGSLQGTPFVDQAVPDCGTPAPPPQTVLETTGGLTHTWSDYSDAGGSQGPSIASNQSVYIACAVQGFQVGDGNTWWYQIASSPWGGAFYASADAFYNNGATSGSLHGTPFVDAAVPQCHTSQPPSTSIVETTGGVTHTWTNYTNAGGTQGPSIPANQTVAIQCALTGFQVSDGNTWWYQIASSPWSGSYYASADAFYNNGATSGSLHGTPFVDAAVPLCQQQVGGASGRSETTGGSAHTWTNYANAGGTQGPSIGGGATVQVLCRVQGFQVSDGNTWWYRVASSPWNNGYYVSADAFYNNGATSGSLLGTPFFDPNVPTC
jgi:hypothetical protein